MKTLGIGFLQCISDGLYETLNCNPRGRDRQLIILVLCYWWVYVCVKSSSTFHTYPESKVTFPSMTAGIDWIKKVKSREIGIYDRDDTTELRV